MSHRFYMSTYKDTRSPSSCSGQPEQAKQCGPGDFDDDDASKGAIPQLLDDKSKEVGTGLVRAWRMEPQ